MQNKIFILSIIAFICVSVDAQTKVANYSFGKSGTDKYEHFSFWSKDGKRTKIEYNYGADRKAAVVTYLGKEQHDSKQAVKLSFTNHYVLYVFPNNNGLSITDSTGKYNKTFTWEYEGPVNGIGTYCEVCTQGEKEAMKLLQTAYFK